jgi:heat shock protein HslJ
MVGIMILSACTIGINNPLDNTRWYLVNLGDEPALLDTEVTIQFENGSVGGKDGCNWYGGTYTVRGDQWSVDDEIASTLILCSEPIMEQAQAYMAALRGASRYQIEDQQLTLLDANGTILATFAAQS